MTMFLTDSELVELSEYVRPKQQIGELARQGIPFRVTRTGRPKVARTAVLQMFGVKASNKTNESIDIDALNEVIGNG